MSSSELSNALNPCIVAQRTRRRHAPTTSTVPHSIPAIQPSLIPQSGGPHRSELESAIAPLPPPQSTQVVPVVQQPQGQQPVPRNALPVVQELFRVLASTRDAATADCKRRITWEHDQEVKNTGMEQQLFDMKQELSMLKAYISMHPNLAPPTHVQQPPEVELVPTTARIEPASPVVDPAPPPPMSPASPMPYHPAAQQPMFVQGSSSRPFSAQGTCLLYTLDSTPSPAPSGCPSPAQITPLGMVHTAHVGLLRAATPHSDGSSCSNPRLLPTPEPESNTRKRPRCVVEDESDYESDTEESDTPAADRPVRRKNGHDDRCLTINHAMRIHIRKMMKLKLGQDLPDSAFEGESIPADMPVRFVWGKTTKQSVTNAEMKKRVVSDIKANRNKYKHVPDKEFGRKNLESVFEQVFTTLRQKHKAQHDSMVATRLKRREDQKALKARRLHRKKAKYVNRSEARKKLDAFSQSNFDGALLQECMSSEESDGEQVNANGETIQTFRTRGLSWRSARLLRFYAILDDRDQFEKSTKPKRGIGRRIRLEGPPKDGFYLPPKGVAWWMISRQWILEAESMRPDLMDILRELVVEPTEPEAEMAQVILGPEGSEDEAQQAVHAVNVYAHVSDTSYSLHNALQPIS